MVLILIAALHILYLHIYQLHVSVFNDTMNFWAGVKGKGTTIFHDYLLQGTQKFPMNVEDEGS